MNPVQYGLIGYSGKMGQEIDALLTESGHQCVFRLDKDRKEEISPPRIIIDFSSPDQLEDTVSLAESISAPLILGTTGLTEFKRCLLQDLSKVVPVVQSNNFSIGIQYLLKAVRYFSTELADWDISITETHHRFKKDKPSGTALMIQQCIDKPVSVESIRIGGVPGDHEVSFGSLGETLAIQHRAISRRTFAEGVLRCIPFILTRKNGFYNFTDVLFPGENHGL